MTKMVAVVLSVVALIGAVGCASTSRLSKLEGKVVEMQKAVDYAVATAGQARVAAQRAEGSANVALTKSTAVEATVGNIQRDQDAFTARFLPVKKFIENHQARDIDIAEASKVRATQQIAKSSGVVTVVGGGTLVAFHPGPLTITNPTASQIKKALEEKRPLEEIWLYGQTNEERQKMWVAFLRIAGETKLDLVGTASNKKPLIAYSNRSLYAAVELRFGPIPATFVSARAAPLPAPKPPTP